MLVNPSFAEYNISIHVDLSDKGWKEGAHDMLYKNPYFFVTTGPNQMRLSLTGREIFIVL